MFRLQGSGKCRDPVLPSKEPLELLPSRLGSQVDEYHIHRNPIEPGGKRTLSPECRQHLPRTDEHLLGQFFCPRLISDYTITDCIDSSKMAAVERLECFRVPVARACDC